MKKKIKLIVGLGNPNSKYKMTRHNLGSKYVKILSKKYKQKLKKNNFFLGKISKIVFNKTKIDLLIPQTYINLSGESIIKYLKYFQIKTKEMIIVHDELDLPPGRIKIKFGGKKFGHNGLKNIKKKVKNEKFYQIKIGIGHPGKKKEVIKYVLEEPNIYEKKLIYTAIYKNIENSKYLFEKKIEKLIEKTNKLKKINT